jgi:hypothetical protein
LENIIDGHWPFFGNPKQSNRKKERWLAKIGKPFFSFIGSVQFDC